MEETAVIEKILEKGSKPEDWIQFLNQEQQGKSSNLTPGSYSHLISLYKKAADSISPENNATSAAYAKILVDLARLQAKAGNADEARTTFQLARNNVKSFAIVYVSWAQFELSQGNRGKCRSLLKKGKQYGATPKAMLQMAFANCVENKDELLDEKTENYSSPEVLLSNQIVLQDTSNCNESLSPEWTQGSHSSADDTSTDSHLSGESTNVSFKLPSVLDGYRNRAGNKRSSSSSSSSGDDTVPLKMAVPGKYLSMSLKKPKSTPKCKSGLTTLANNMNLSVRRSTKAKRGLLGNSLAFGIPMRVEEEPVSEENGKNVISSSQISWPGSAHQLEVPCEENKENCISKAGTTICNESSKSFAQEIDNLSSTRTGKNESYHAAISLSLKELHKQTTEKQMLKDKQNEEIQNLKVFSGPVQKQTSNSVTLCQHHKPHSSCGFCNQVAQPKDCNALPCTEHQLNCNTGLHHSYSGPFQNRNFSQGNVSLQLGLSNLHSVLPTPVMANKTVVVNGKSYLELEAIGRGGSSRVYKCFDGKRVCAVKHVNLEDADKTVVDSYINEITLLKSLQGNENVIKLYDWELNQEAKSILLVMECGSIDLAGFLRKNRQQINDNDLRTYWNQMLNTVQAIHTKGIIHSDLKPANFLFVEGKLKLIDFGIANAIQGDKTSIIRESQMGTLNYMSPEALQDTSYGGQPSVDGSGRQKPCLKIGRASDVWSLGCILYYMVYGKTPFQHITNQLMKLQCILDQNYRIEFPKIKGRHLMDTIEGCLCRDPRQRYTISQLLEHPYISSGEFPDEKQFFDCLMQFKSRHDVNSPRSIRALTKGLVKQLQSGEKINLSEVLPADRPSSQCKPSLT